MGKRLVAHGNGPSHAKIDAAVTAESVAMTTSSASAAITTHQFAFVRRFSKTSIYEHASLAGTSRVGIESFEIRPATSKRIPPPVCLSRELFVRTTAGREREIDRAHKIEIYGKMERESEQPAKITKTKREHY